MPAKVLRRSRVIPAVPDAEGETTLDEQSGRGPPSEPRGADVQLHAAAVDASHLPVGMLALDPHALGPAADVGRPLTQRHNVQSAVTTATPPAGWGPAGPAAATGRPA